MRTRASSNIDWAMGAGCWAGAGEARSRQTTHSPTAAPTGRATSGPLEPAADGGVELALHEAQDAVALGAAHADALHEPLAHAADERLPRPLYPACGGRPVHLVERAELVDRQPIDHVLAQQVLLAGRERLERLLEGLA